jgi:hypothetical protein
MTRRSRNAVLLILAGAIGSVAAAQQKSDGWRSAQAGSTLRTVTPGQIQWTDPPAGVARGTPSVEPGGSLRYAALEGDPLKAGVPYTIRLQCSDGYKAAPHWHPEDEHIVVLSGAFSVGTGNAFDSAKLVDIPLHGFGLVPARMNHFALCKGETDIVVYGIGPRLNHWIPAGGAGERAGSANPSER